MSNMVTITKKQASVLTILAVVAAVMFSGPIASDTVVNQAFAWGCSCGNGWHHGGGNIWAWHYGWGGGWDDCDC